MGIDKDRSLQAEAIKLRRQAEELLLTKRAEFQPPRTGEDTQRLVHELEVHQIELEMQNTMLRQTRDDLEKTAEMYSDLYDFAPVSYFTLDQEGVVQAANLRGAALLGIERSRLPGRGFGLFVIVADRPAFADFLGKVFASEGKESCELTLLNKKNLPIFAQIEAVAFTAEHKCHIAVIDITERKRAEAEIQRLASFPLMNPNPVLELDANGQMTFCNPAAKKYLEEGGYVASINPFIPRDLPLILQDLRAKKADQFSREIEIDGSYFEELIYVASPFKSVRIYTMDITKRKRAEEEIERLNTDLAARADELEVVNQELEAFNYTVAHDLRRPLTVVNGYCQAIKEICGNKLDEKCRNYLREAYEGTLRMNRLIDDLLNFSRLARVETQRETVDLTAMAYEVAAELQLCQPARLVDIRIVTKIVVNGDPNLLQVVLTNLLGNAWKYTATREEGIIEFGMTEVDGKPVCFVRDNGSGFNMVDADKLFVPFQRLHGAEEFSGFGIGLATVERIIKRHGGRVWAEGELGKGATFYFTLSAD